MEGERRAQVRTLGTGVGVPTSCRGVDAGQGGGVMMPMMPLGGLRMDLRRGACAGVPAAGMVLASTGCVGFPTATGGSVVTTGCAGFPATTCGEGGGALEDDDAAGCPGLGMVAGFPALGLVAGMAASFPAGALEGGLSEAADFSAGGALR